MRSKNVDYSKHSGVITHFEKEYIKSGVFDRKYSNYINEAFKTRNNTDYSDFFIVYKKDAEEQYEKAVEFYAVIEKYLCHKIDSCS